VAHYHLLTVWRIEAPLEAVYLAVQNSLRWPEWWPGVLKAEQLSAGDADGINSVRRYCWQGQLPYQVVFEVCATRIEPLLLIEGRASGDLEGVGRWHFSRDGAVSVVRYEWQVRSTRRWMNLIAPIARPIFVRNHTQLMAQGATGLARLLGAPLVGQENVDLMAASTPTKHFRGSAHEGGQINPMMVLVAGLGAGVLATVAQLVLWWLTETPPIETLLRDARLTAALVMGPGVLPPPNEASWDILLAATVIHFGLSIAYALLPASLPGCWRTVPALFAGALYGLLIYGVNLYGFTLLFPWFELARGWVTLVAHLVFGIALAGCCLLFSVCWRTEPKDIDRHARQHKHEES